ncbi:hypothetical protein [Paraburkholderia sp. EG304]|uniref:hypothetical protein n=1 Tax=Paraburkholderia sp. EG304 TaxID=3237015 RepID=UPI00397CCB0F
MRVDPLDPITGEHVNARAPWRSEPDYLSFEAAGLRCVIRRVPELKHLCGYVGVGRSHPLFEVERTDLVPVVGDWRANLGRNVDEHGAVDIFFTLLQDHQGEIPEGFAPLNMLIGVHGGLTFSDRFYDHTGWWFGFDCGHAGDFTPGLAEALEGMGRDASFLREHGVYRTVEYVRHECATLAQQIADWSERIGHIDAARDVIERMRAQRKISDD